MRFHYDKQEDALYIRFSEGEYKESEEVQAGVIFDFDRRRRIVGIEILKASTRLSPRFAMRIPSRKAVEAYATAA